MVEPITETIIDQDTGDRHDTLDIVHDALDDAGTITLVVSDDGEWAAIDLTAPEMIRLRDALTELIYEAGVEEESR